MGLQQRPSTPRARGRQPALGTWPPSRAARSSCSACCSAGCGCIGPLMRLEGALQRPPYHEVCAGFAEQLLSSTSGCSIVSEFAALGLFHAFTMSRILTCTPSSALAQERALCPRI